MTFEIDKYEWNCAKKFTIRTFENFKFLRKITIIKKREMANCDFIVRYNSKVAPRNTISRANPVTGSKGERTDMYSLNSYKQVGYGAGIPLQRSRSAAVIAINENKSGEKRALTALNDKFATLIERVRYLEALNKKIQMEHDSLKSLEGQKSDGIKRMYQNEIKECENLSAQAYRDHSMAEDKRMKTELQVGCSF